MDMESAMITILVLAHQVALRQVTASCQSMGDPGSVHTLCRNFIRNDGSLAVHVGDVSPQSLDGRIVTCSAPPYQPRENIPCPIDPCQQNKICYEVTVSGTQNLTCICRFGRLGTHCENEAKLGILQGRMGIKILSLPEFQPSQYLDGFVYDAVYDYIDDVLYITNVSHMVRRSLKNESIEVVGHLDNFNPRQAFGGLVIDGSLEGHWMFVGYPSLNTIKRYLLPDLDHVEIIYQPNDVKEKFGPYQLALFSKTRELYWLDILGVRRCYISNCQPEYFSMFTLEKTFLSMLFASLAIDDVSEVIMWNETSIIKRADLNNRGFTRAPDAVDELDGVSGGVFLVINGWLLIHHADTTTLSYRYLLSLKGGRPVGPNPIPGGEDWQTEPSVFQLMAAMIPLFPQN